MTERRHMASWGYWGIWMLTGLYFTSMDLVSSATIRQHPMRNVLVNQTLHLVWGGLVLVVLRGLGRRTLESFRGWKTWAFYLAMSLAMTVVGTVVAFFVLEALGGPSVPLPAGTLSQKFWFFQQHYFHIAFLEFLVAMGAWLAFDLYHRYRHRELEASRLEVELARAQHQALRMQLQPHFLFNALNTISSLIRAEPDSAERMVSRLGDLLRYTLEQSGPQEVSLRQELVILDCYLEIQRLRFGNRLGIEVLCPDELHTAQVPNLLLQPLVENAFKHGLGRRSKDSRLTIRICRMDDMLRLEVEDNGKGLGTGPLREGIGTTNTRTRLAMLYGEKHGFDLLDSAQGGTLARIDLPLHWKPLDVDAEEDVEAPLLTPSPQLRPSVVS